MNIRKILTYLASFTLVIVIAVFAWNVYQHGQIVHPGKALYKAQCAQCHGENGEGIQQLVPPLGDKAFTEANFDSIPCWLKNGMNHPIVVNGITYDQPMYPNQLDEIQAANVINFINREFAGLDKEIGSRWVKEKWKNCP